MVLVQEEVDFVSRWVSLDGPVHYADFGGSGVGRPVVCVHGLGGSHINWMAVGPGLAEHGRVYAPDMSGFGRTPPSDRGSTVAANRQLLSDFLAEVVGEPAILIGNSMGGTLSILQAGTEPETVAGIVLVGPAVPRALLAPFDPTVAKQFAAHAVPGFGAGYLKRRIEQLGPEGIIRETLDLCCVDADRVPTRAIEAATELRRERMAMPWAHESFLDASRSLMLTLLRRRSFDAHIAAIDAPGLIVQGAEDRLVPEVNARRVADLRPDWRYEVLHDVGHVPQLEVPELFIRLVNSWMSQLPAGTPRN